MPYLSLAYLRKGEPMENTPRLYCELVALMGQQRQWRDRRHLQTFIWMMVGLIHSGCVSLTAWVPFVTSRARYAQSTPRRFARWLQNQRIEVHICTLSPDGAGRVGQPHAVCVAGLSPPYQERRVLVWGQC